MKVLVLLCLCLLCVPELRADDRYREGTEFAEQALEQGLRTMENFRPEKDLPGYDPSPAQAQHWGGVEASTDNLKTSAGHLLTESEAGKTIMDSITAARGYGKVSLDAPFIVAGKKAQASAEQVTDGSIEGCEKKQVTHSEFTRHVCSRDVQVEQLCTRTATVNFDEADEVVTREVTIGPDDWILTPDGPAGVKLSWRLKYPATVLKASFSVPAYYYSCEYFRRFNSRGTCIQGLGTWLTLFGITWFGQDEWFNSLSVRLNAGVQQIGTFSPASSAEKLNIRVKLLIRSEEKKSVPRIDWTEHCPFEKGQVTPVKSTCTQPGAERVFHTAVQTHRVQSPCWQYQDSYVTQQATPGSCAAFASNPSCSVATRQCAFLSEGNCLHENVTFNCEHRTSGSGLLCGGRLFCRDGSCASTAAKQQGQFQQVVSQLAAVASAARDVASANGAAASAFTGRAMACSKQAVGFNNCCRDSGWGNDIGLAHCSSDEKALMQAQSRQLTIGLGEWCSRRVLGACIEKKRSYCVFDSRLAQIVQQQGRQWQLGIGFGSAESPDCRGISVEQLQKLNFARMDFSGFYADLMKGKSIPSQEALQQQAREKISAAFSSGLPQ